MGKITTPLNKKQQLEFVINHPEDISVEHYIKDHYPQMAESAQYATLTVLKLHPNQILPIISLIALGYRLREREEELA